MNNTAKKSERQALRDKDFPVEIPTSTRKVAELIRRTQSKHDSSAVLNAWFGQKLRNESKEPITIYLGNPLRPEGETNS